MEINQYPNESLSFNDNDLYDIDFFNGVGYETKKILGSTIKAGIRLGVFILASNTTDDITEGTKKFNIAHTGEVTGSGALTITPNAVTNAKLAQIGTGIIKGRATAGTGNVEDLTATQVTAVLNVFTDLLKGLVPASGGGTVNFLRADGAWSSIPIAPIGGGQVLLETAVGSAVTTVAYISVHNIILGGGTWLITITGECTNNTNNQSIFTAIGVAGVYEPATGREYRTRLANAYAPFATQKIVTFVGIQTVSMMAKIVTGTGFIRNRVITAVKLS
jgi:hypothetical protein